jgi:hypothetical protein
VCVFQVSGLDDCNEAVVSALVTDSWRRGSVQEDADDSAHEEAEEAETVLADVEAVVFDKDERECLELVRQPRIQDVMLRVLTRR